MAQQILLRRGTALQWTTANPILAQGEQGLETDTNLIKIGDGSTTWTLLSYTSAIGLLKANNLSDLANVVTARTNLGLGTLATQNGTFSGTSSGTNTGDNAVNSSSQPVNTNLTSLSGLTYSSLSFIKMTAAGTFTLDTNTYLTTISGTANYIPKFSGSGVLSNSELYANGSELIWGISGAASTVSLSLKGTAGGYYNNLNFYGETFSGYGLQISIGTYGNEMLLGANQYRFRVGGVDKMWLNSNGRLLLNTTTDSGYLLDVNGTVRIQSTTLLKGLFEVNNHTQYLDNTVAFTVSDNSRNYLFNMYDTGSHRMSLSRQGGFLKIGGAIGSTVSNVMLTVEPTATSDVGFVIKANASQSVNLLELRNSSNINLSYFNNIGALNIGATTASTSTTTGALVVVGGVGIAGALYGTTGNFTSAVSASNISGTNTGDQTITLTGAVTGSGTGSFVTTLASAIVGISNLSATGTPDSTTFLRGDNTWATPAGGSGITIGTTTITSGTDKKLLYNNSNVVDESTIYFDGTNTGFGTSSPQARIDIVGNNGVRFLLYGTGGTVEYLAGLGVNLGQGTNSMGFFTGQNSDFTVEQATTFQAYPYAGGYTTRFVIARSTGHAGFNVISPTAAVHIKAGTTTVPPLKINSGTLVSTITGSVNDGALEYASSHLYFTIGSTRYQLDQQGGGVSDGDKGDVVVSSSGTVWTLDTVTANKGGTGQTSYAVGDLLFATGTTNLGKLAAVATGNVLISGGVTTAPSWGKVGLTTHVSGTLSITNGGTGITSAGIGSLLIGNGSTSFNTLVGNTTTTKKYLTQTGDGVDSDDPVWESLETAGIPWITYSDTATWNGTAPSGATTHEYRYYQIGKMVFGFIRLEYATAGISNTTLTLATNSFPVISKPSNCSNGENLTACTGYIDSSNIGSPPATRCWMEASANTSGFVVKFVVGSQSAKFAMCSFTYLTA